MKTLLTFLTAVVIGFMFLSGCGKDGADGRAYISYDWDWYVDWYDDNNSSLSNIYANTNYETSPGTFNYEYGCSDGNGYAWGFYGTYTITINAGESGGMISDGASGADNYFRFNLYGSGPDFYLSKPFNKEKKEVLSRNTETTQGQRRNVGEMTIEILRGPTATMTITRQKFVIE